MSDVETHRAVFTWVQERLVAAGLRKEEASTQMSRAGRAGPLRSFSVWKVRRKTSSSREKS